MDEASASVILDLSGRSYLVFDAGFSSDVVGDLTTQMVPHFFHSLVSSAGINAHISASGENDHHVIEAIFKAFGIALRRSATVERSDIPSTKGVLTG
jgi:imidazoleglycerol-phosphate dehydratase/histidinol-phosphatase